MPCIPRLIGIPPLNIEARDKEEKEALGRQRRGKRLVDLLNIKKLTCLVGNGTKSLFRNRSRI